MKDIAQIKKIRWLEKKVKDFIQNIETIKFYCHVPINTVQSAGTKQYEKQFFFLH